MNLSPISSAAAENLIEGKSTSARPVWGAGILLVCSILFCYAEVLVGMVRQWWDISFYSYAFLIPVISAYLVWIRRDQLLAITPRPNYASGAVLVGAGLLALLIGRAGGIKALQQVSFLVTIPGVILFVFGKAVLKALLLPIMFLWFMIPIWEVVTDPLHLPFQAFSANVGVVLLRGVGVPVFQDGVFIHLPNITLEVARACSGVNYLIAVLATSIPLATIVLRDVRRRIVLVLLAMTVSALANSLRVALIGFLAYYDLSGDLHGPYHVLHGVFVSLMGYLAIFGGLWALARGQHASDPKPSVSPELVRTWKITWRNVRFSWSLLSAVVLLVGVSRYIDWAQPVPLTQDLSALSLESVGWIGREVPFTEQQGADQSLSRMYWAPSGEKVHLSIWYFEAQTQGKELISAGTAKLHAGARRIKARLGQQEDVEVNRLIRQEGKKTQVVLFWYELNGRRVAAKHAAKFYTALDAVMSRRTNGALVWLAADLASNDPHEQERTLATLTEFASKLDPILSHYLPRSSN